MFAARVPLIAQGGQLRAGAGFHPDEEAVVNLRRPCSRISRIRSKPGLPKFRPPSLRNNFQFPGPIPQRCAGLSRPRKHRDARSLLAVQICHKSFLKFPRVLAWADGTLIFGAGDRRGIGDGWGALRRDGEKWPA